ncbi:UPF0058 family protein [Haladaptatus pallidirubidus]|uniref:UPF0058 family protein n=1 Tax=Haladaptatus pallidirubidus TaxID=1008152 RepID=A0AAV3UHA2_9EURY|nr:UPF0058 family protein [Haladaptatus pallidirubidus]
MKKQELIHLHSLLIEVKDQYEAWNDETIKLQNYEDAGVYPTSIHRSKTAHRDSVFILTNEITEKMANPEIEITPDIK